MTKEQIKKKKKKVNNKTMVLNPATEQFIDAVIKTAVAEKFRSLWATLGVEQALFDDYYQNVQMLLRKSLSNKNKLSDSISRMDEVFGTTTTRESWFFQGVNYVKDAIRKNVTKSGYLISWHPEPLYRNTRKKKSDGSSEYKSVYVIKEEKRIGRDLTKEEAREFIKASTEKLIIQGEGSVKLNDPTYWMWDIHSRIDLNIFYEKISKFLTLFLATENQEVRSIVLGYKSDNSKRDQAILSHFYRRFAVFLANVDREYTSVPEDLAPDIWDNLVRRAKTWETYTKRENELFKSRLFEEYKSIVLG